MPLTPAQPSTRGLPFPPTPGPPPTLQVPHLLLPLTLPKGGAGFTSCPMPTSQSPSSP